MPHIMNPIAVPVTVVEAPVSNGFKLQQQGTWIGEVEDVQVKPLPPFAGGPTSGYASADGEVVTVRFGNQQPTEGQEEYKGKAFLDLVTRDGELDISSDDIPENAWRLYQSKVAAVKLAIGLGVAQVVEVNGQPCYVPAEGFFDSLIAGQFNGQKVGYIIGHGKPYKNKAGETKQDIKFQNFFPAA